MDGGERFGPYRIESLLGRGGMGEVYRAFDESQKRIVALKVLSPHLAADESFRARFRRESELAARLSEAHVIPIHRYGEIDGRLFIDMRLVAGVDLGSLIERVGGLPAGRAIGIVSQVARALDAAHADGLIHRDVKPSNVLVGDRDEDGDDDFVYLVDFGIARASEDDGQGLTKTGSALGTFDYMAPERFLEGAVDRRTDVYSLACLLYECLTGRRPFSGEGLPALMYGHLHTLPPRPSEAVGSLPEAMDEVIARGMAKRPEDRFGRAGDLASAARRALRSGSGTDSGPVTDPARSAPTSTFSWPGRDAGPRPGLAGAGAASAPPPGWNTGPGIRTPDSYPGQVPFPGSYHPSGPHPVGAGSSGLSTGRAVLILAVVVTLVAVGTIGALLIARSDSPGTTASPGGTTQVTEGDTEEPVSEPEPDPEDALRDLVPVDFRQAACRTADPAGDGDLAVLECGPSQAPGPTFSQFLLYGDPEQTRAIFEEDMQLFGVPRDLSLRGCVANVGYTTYTDDGVTAGYYTCRITDGFAAMSWTEDDFSFYGFVALEGGEAELALLFEWWNQHSAASP